MKRLLLIIINVAFITMLNAQSITIDGNVYLEGQTNYENIMIVFERTIPSSLLDTAYTDSNGYFNKNIQTGFYNITFSKSDFISNTLNDIELYNDTTLNNLTLEEIGLNGQLSGILNAGEYKIGGDIFVNTNDTLTLLPGVIFKFSENVNFTINGVLIAAGNENDSIVFTAYDIAKKWRGIKFTTYSTNSTMSFCKINYCNNGALVIDNCSPKITNSTITHNEFFSNEQESGAAGIHLINSNSIIKNVEIEYDSLFFIDNFSAYYLRGAGGICCYGGTPKLINLEVHNNYSEISCLGAGGIACLNNTQTTITNCIIYSNFGNYGGAISCQSDGLKIYNTTITKNSARYGGGVFISVSDPNIYNTIITQNKATEDGNEIGISCSVSTTSHPTIQNCNFEENSVSDIYIDNDCDSEPIPYFLEIHTTNSNGDDCDPYYNILEPVLFTDTLNNDYSIRTESSCIDAGNNNLIDIEYDFNTNIRTWDGNNNGDTIVDIGAFEYGSIPYDEINQIFDKMSLLVYPNPSSGMFSLDYNINNFKSIQIINVNGEIIKQYDKYNNNINISEQPNGLYIIKLILNDKILTKRVIKI